MTEFKLQEYVKKGFVEELTELCYSDSNIYLIESEIITYRNVDFTVNLHVSVYNKPEFEWKATRLEPKILNKDFKDVLFYIYPRRTKPYQRISYKMGDLPNLEGIDKQIHFIINETFQLIDDILDDMEDGLQNKINYVESGYEQQKIIIEKVKKSMNNLKGE